MQASTHLTKITKESQELTPRDLPVPFSSRVNVDVYGISDRGRVRSNNEDHFLVMRGGRTLEAVQGNLPGDMVSSRFDEVFYGIVVADGLGGLAGGEIASRRAIESLLCMVLDTPDWILKLGKPEINEVMWRMADRFIRVNAELIQEAANQPQLDGMATTMTAAVTMGDDLILAHVGDSRAYVMRDGKLKQLTRDQTLAQRLIDDGTHTHDDALVKGLRNVLEQALGSKAAECRPDVLHLKLMDGDWLMLCTDGLSDMVEESVIEHVLNEASTAKPASEALLDLALRQGGKDNITVVVAKYAIPLPANQVPAAKVADKVTLSLPKAGN